MSTRNRASTVDILHCDDCGKIYEPCANHLIDVLKMGANPEKIERLGDLMTAPSADSDEAKELIGEKTSSTGKVWITQADLPRNHERYSISAHAKERARQRSVHKTEIKDAIENGSIRNAHSGRHMFLHDETVVLVEMQEKHKGTERKVPIVTVYKD